MSDNFVTNPGVGGATFASDDVGGIQFPRIKRSVGRDSQAADVATPFKLISGASTNATLVKNAPGCITAIVVTNTNAAPRYLKLYNKATAPTVGTDAPAWTICIPGSTAGGGAVIALDPALDFSLGIGIGLTTGAADTDTGAVAANEIVVNLGYV
jgi:hypothetical protein